MDIILYNTTDDSRKLNKTLTAIKTISVRLKDDTDIMHPVIELDAANLPPTANYCYIAVFNRYYFINQQGIRIGRDLTLTLAVDVLMSFKITILNSRVIAAKSTNRCNKNLPDNIPLLAKRNVIYKRLSGGISDVGAFGSDQVSKSTPCVLLSVINTSGGITPDGSPTLRIQDIDGKAALLEWTEVKDSDYYWVYRKKLTSGGSDEFELIANLYMALEYTDTVSPGSYAYKVRPVRNGEPGSYSNIVEITLGG